MRKVYGYIGRIVSLIGYPLFFTYFRLNPSRRVRILVLDKDKQILLVRGWLGFQKWTLPGGGCKNGESDEMTAARELFEETGIKVNPREFTLIKESKDPELGHIVPLLVVRIKSYALEPLKGRAAIEIIDRSWWSQDNLPARCSPLVNEMLESLRSGVK